MIEFSLNSSFSAGFLLVPYNFKASYCMNWFLFARKLRTFASILAEAGPLYVCFAIQPLMNTESTLNPMTSINTTW